MKQKSKWITCPTCKGDRVMYSPKAHPCKECNGEGSICIREYQSSDKTFTVTRR